MRKLPVSATSHKSAQGKYSSTQRALVAEAPKAPKAVKAELRAVMAREAVKAMNAKVVTCQHSNRRKETGNRIRPAVAGKS